MSERQEVESKELVGRELLSPINVFRTAEFADGTIASGGIVSGGGLTLRAVSSPSNIRLLNLHLFNNEAGWVEVVFKDGGTAGGRVLGPFRLGGFTERKVPYQEMLGRKFTSSVYAEVRSGWIAQPLSTGVNVNAGFVLEPTDLFM
jgi:hypothetical protein